MNELGGDRSLGGSTDPLLSVLVGDGRDDNLGVWRGAMMEPKYRWVSAFDWLEYRAKKWTKEQLYQELMTLAGRLGNDPIQDEYESEMSRDGYFEPIKKRK